ncbi:hypothetical protein BN903_91 [Halorubrum sp. AJ67]|nr:hypothetical protein BN903_91 [Halorubrum sp. AJ67]
MLLLAPPPTFTSSKQPLRGSSSDIYHFENVPPQSSIRIQTLPIL